jgi:hypothetical protein
VTIADLIAAAPAGVDAAVGACRGIEATLLQCDAGSGKGNFEAGHPAREGLQDSESDVRIRHDRGPFAVSDGSFAEAKELIGGSAIVNVGSKQEAKMLQSAPSTSPAKAWAVCRR